VFSCFRRGFRRSSRATTPSIDALGRARIIRESRVLLVSCSILSERELLRARDPRRSVSMSASTRKRANIRDPLRVFLAKGRSERTAARKGSDPLFFFTRPYASSSSLPFLCLPSEPAGGIQRAAGPLREGRGIIYRRRAPLRGCKRIAVDSFTFARTCPSFARTRTSLTDFVRKRRRETLARSLFLSPAEV